MLSRKKRIKLSRSKTQYMLVNESDLGGKVEMQKGEVVKVDN